MPRTIAVDPDTAGERGTAPASEPVEDFVRRLLATSLVRGFRAVEGPPLWSGARPWSRRLRLTTFEAILQNQQLGIRYVPVPAFAPGLSEETVLTAPEQVLRELTTRGAVVAQLPPPFWAAAICIGWEATELAWLTPLPPALSAGVLPAGIP